MGRTAGTRNPDYEDKRRALSSAVIPRLLDAGPTASMRELASAAEVSVPTLRHYFGDRDGVVVAAMSEWFRRGEPYLQRTRQAGHDGLRASLVEMLASLLQGWRVFGVGRIYGAGLAMGLGHEVIGPAYVEQLLEPLLQAVEARLGEHQRRGELQACDLRFAALSLVSPVVLALLHQDGLGGSGCRALDVEDFVEQHVAGFIRGYGSEPSAAD